jgi:hypothetical protein
MNSIHVYLSVPMYHALFFHIIDFLTITVDGKMYLSPALMDDYMTI